MSGMCRGTCREVRDKSWDLPGGTGRVRGPLGIERILS